MQLFFLAATQNLFITLFVTMLLDVKVAEFWIYYFVSVAFSSIIEIIVYWKTKLFCLFSGTTCIVGHFEAKKLLFELAFDEKSGSPTTQEAAEKKCHIITVEKLIGEVILTPYWDAFSHFRITGSFMGRPQLAKVTLLDETKIGASSSAPITAPTSPTTPSVDQGKKKQILNGVETCWNELG